MNKDVIKIIIKALIYIFGLVASYFGISSVVSCTVSRSSDIEGRAVIVTVDTTVVNHSGTFNFSKK